MMEAQLQALYLAALLLMVDCICCVIAAYRKNPTLGAVAGGGTAGSLALVLLTSVVPFPMAALASIVVGAVIAWMKVKALSPVEVTHG
ncbi:hypothetical protein B0B35_29980 [Pseudomonas aeruginosa]|uniref:hypothetical protein n=1 Tax=Pseudomonas aeruginosa TaxID=287 RepID=UPI00097E6693|nr:hypothetical protein [Pseudomonas aeruginosa]ONN17524.1 hypothetical protein B0B17_30300 [Pseudomonas aeruginosa]OOH01221.1 hypothetical protein B0B35_29980 [Pseudomonas aeruginosa]